MLPHKPNNCTKIPKEKKIGPNLKKNSTELSDISLLPTRPIKWGTGQTFGINIKKKIVNCL